MGFFNKLISTRQTTKPPPTPTFPLIREDQIDPNKLWLTSKELGDGAFGKVYKVTFAASPDTSLQTSSTDANFASLHEKLRSKVSKINPDQHSAAKIIPFSNTKDYLLAYNNELKEYY